MMLDYDSMPMNANLTLNENLTLNSNLTLNANITLNASLALNTVNAYFNFNAINASLIKGKWQYIFFPLYIKVYLLNDQI